jgi:electron transfer flavoprotein alpha subunit
MDLNIVMRGSHVRVLSPVVCITGWEEKRMATLIIETETCTGCEACVSSCPFGALSMKDKVAVVDEKCTFCGACVDVCPVSAITLEKDQKAVAVDTSAYKNVWVYVEHERGR